MEISEENTITGVNGIRIPSLSPQTCSIPEYAIHLQRANYLWQMAHRLIEKNQSLSNYYMGCLMQLVRQYKFQLSAEVRMYICRHCGCLSIPGVSTTTKIQSRTSKSRINRTRAKLRQAVTRRLKHNPRELKEALRQFGSIQNEIQVTCHICDLATFFPGSSSRAKSKTDSGKPSRDMSVSANTSRASLTQSMKKPEPSKRPTVQCKPVESMPKLLDQKPKKKKKKKDSSISSLQSFLHSLK